MGATAITAIRKVSKERKNLFLVFFEYTINKRSLDFLAKFLVLQLL